MDNEPRLHGLRCLRRSGPRARGSPLALDWAASRYHQGRYTVYEVLAEHTCQDMGCIVALERVETSDASGITITRERRLTHVVRREPEGWRIVHQHSDPLVTVTPQPT